MKNLILILLIFAVFSCTNDYSYVESLKENDINEIFKNRDIKGNPKKENEINDWMNLGLLNSPSKMTILKFDKNDKQDFKTTSYTFNESGFIITCENFFKENITTIVNYKYNDLKYKTQEITSSQYHSGKSIADFKYDNNGQKIYDSSIWHNIYLYDKNYNLICDLSFDADGNFLRKTVFYYNEKNQNHLTIEYVDDSNNFDMKIERKFNDKGLPIEEKYNLCKLYHGTPEVEIITYAYEFDENDNWIKRIRNSEKFGKTSEKRIFEY